MPDSPIPCLRTELVGNIFAASAECAGVIPCLRTELVGNSFTARVEGAGVIPWISQGFHESATSHQPPATSHQPPWLVDLGKLLKDFMSQPPATSHQPPATRGGGTVAFCHSLSDSESELKSRWGLARNLCSFAGVIRIFRDSDRNILATVLPHPSPRLPRKFTGKNGR